jgi:hypothetical protein
MDITMKSIFEILSEKNINKVKISIEELEKLYKANDYLIFANIIFELINTEQIKPIKTSGLNGKKPALFTMYKIIAKKEIDNEILEELKYKLHPVFQLGYYNNNIDTYKVDRENIIKLSEFLKHYKEQLNLRISLNERSFQVWQKEKYLKNGGGKKLLSNLGLDISYLNTYDTNEPLAYYSQRKSTPQNILILENADTFYSFREYLIKKQDKILGIDIGTLIYGRGKGIIKSFSEFDLIAEPYLLNKNNEIFYFGDLDYEGIIIYESFYKQFHKDYNIKPFKEGYIQMLKYAKNLDLPITKDGQNRNIDDVFKNNFTNEEKKLIDEILTKNLYIPQEILNVGNI